MQYEDHLKQRDNLLASLTEAQRKNASPEKLSALLHSLYYSEQGMYNKLDHTNREVLAISHAINALHWLKELKKFRYAHSFCTGVLNNILYEKKWENKPEVQEYLVSLRITQQEVKLQNDHYLETANKILAAIDEIGKTEQTEYKKEAALEAKRELRQFWRISE